MNAAETPDASPDLDDPEIVYELKNSSGVKPVLFPLGGLVMLGVAGIEFLLGLVLPAEAQAFPVMIATTVMPTLGAFRVRRGVYAHAIAAKDHRRADRLGRRRTRRAATVDLERDRLGHDDVGPRAFRQNFTARLRPSESAALRRGSMNLLDEGTS